MAKPPPTTVEGWLKTLPRGYRELALSRMQKPNYEVHSLCDAIDYMCTWDQTPEGDEFWGDLYNWTSEENPSLPIPKLHPNGRKKNHR